MRVLILGAGAVGSYLGARLLSVGADVFILARGQRLADLSTTGVVIKSPLGDLTHTVKAAAVPPTGFVPDIAVIACKAPSLGDALDAIAPHIGQATRLLPVLNGVAHMETVQRQFPDNSVLGGIAHGALTLRQDGVVEHLTPFFSMIVGPMASASDAAAADFVELARKSGVDARLSSNIRQDLWDKFVFLTTLAGITCLMRASIGTIMSSDDGRDLVVQLLEENLAVARAEGFGPDATSMASYKRSLTERGSKFTSSMLRDIQGGRHTEADHILGDMLRRARKHGLDTPLLKTAYAHLQCYETALP